MLLDTIGYYYIMAIMHLVGGEKKTSAEVKKSEEINNKNESITRLKNKKLTGESSHYDR